MKSQDKAEPVNLKERDEFFSISCLFRAHKIASRDAISFPRVGIFFIFSVHVRYVLSPVRLSVASSVTFVRPTQQVEIFGNVSTPLGTLNIN